VSLQVDHNSCSLSILLYDEQITHLIQRRYLRKQDVGSQRNLDCQADEK
jgi:hypothetical protein